jgi:hypothetical protein
MNDIAVPKVDMNEPLPELNEPQIDLVMVKAAKDWHYGIVLFAVMVLIVGAVAVSYSSMKVINEEMPKQVPIASSEPVATFNKTVETKPVFIILNGSGVTGAAAKLADNLKTLGYDVAETGNAPVQTGTTVELTSELESQKDQIMDIVGVQNVPAGPGLAGGLKYNVKVIIGK